MHAESISWAVYRDSCDRRHAHQQFSGAAGLPNEPSSTSSGDPASGPTPRPAHPRASDAAERRAGDIRKHLVVVTPDEALAARLKDRLELDGFDIETAPTAAAAVRINAERPPSMFITAPDLPDVSGLELAGMLKQQTPQGQPPPSVVVIADAADARQTVRALREGADDYVASVRDEMDVLAARVQAVLRRRSAQATPRANRETERIITVGSITIRPSAFTVTVNAEKVDLTLTQFRLLLMLAERPGRLVRPEEIQRHLAERGSQLQESSVKSHVYFLRQKLGDASDQIENVRRVGYRLREG